MAFAPDVRLDKPGMLYPRRSPAQRMKIDWTNPLSKGLKFYALVRPGAFIEELVQGYTLDLTTATIKVEAGRAGPCIRNTGTSGTSIEIPPIKTLDGITLLVHATLNETVTNNPQILFSLEREVLETSDEFAALGYDWNGTIPGMNYKTKSEGYYNNFFYSDNKVVLGEPSSIITTPSLDLFITGYANGRGLYNDVHETYPSYLEDMNLDTLRLGGYHYNYNSYSLSDIYAMAAFDGNMHKDQMRQLSIDPYAFLIPDRG